MDCSRQQHSLLFSFFLSLFAVSEKKVDITLAKNVTFSYSVFVPDQFDFRIPVKLPGIYGGTKSFEGKQSTGDDDTFQAYVMVSLQMSIFSTRQFTLRKVRRFSIYVKIYFVNGFIFHFRFKRME
jgi:hypothetical protein